MNYSPLTIKLEFVWSSEHCTRRFDDLEFKEYYIKNFRKLRRVGYALSQVIMIDDSPEKHSRNFGNFITVREFLGDNDDNELELLMKYLLEIKNCTDIRTIEKRNWKKGLMNN